jgi:hypothetical protein
MGANLKVVDKESNQKSALSSSHGQLKRGPQVWGRVLLDSTHQSNKGGHLWGRHGRGKLSSHRQQAGGGPHSKGAASTRTVRIQADPGMTTVGSGKQ